MLHEGYIDIPALPEPLQEMFWQRQELVRRIGEAATVLCAATKDYNELIAQLIQMNDEIRREEG